MTLLNKVHEQYVHSRRVEVLAGHLARLLPPRARVADVGCGDGLLASRILALRGDLCIEGYDVLVRPGARIVVHEYDGLELPCNDRSFDAVLLVDVLHHTADPQLVLAEAARVAQTAVVIKDHYADGWFAREILRFMDRVGNARHGVALPYNYLKRRQWEDLFAALGLRKAVEITAMDLYPWYANWLFGRSLHFIAKLEPSCAGSNGL